INQAVSLKSIGGSHHSPMEKLKVKLSGREGVARKTRNVAVASPQPLSTTMASSVVFGSLAARSREAANCASSARHSACQSRLVNVSERNSTIAIVSADAVWAGAGGASISQSAPKTPAANVRIIVAPPDRHDWLNSPEGHPAIVANAITSS